MIKGAGISVSSPYLVEWTPRDLYVMAQAGEFSEWLRTARIAEVVYNSNPYLKRHQSKRTAEFLPPHYQRMLHEKTTGREIRAPGVPCSLMEMKTALLGKAAFKTPEPGGGPKPVGRSSPRRVERDRLPEGVELRVRRGKK